MREEEIEDLQSRLAFQEDAIDHLNKTVAQQSEKIDQLQQQLQIVYGSIKVLAEQQGTEGISGIEIPPHY